MDRAHWGLSYSPFRSCGDGLLFHASGSGEEALARLHFLVEERRRFGILSGDSGAGKSTLLVRFASELVRAGGAVALVNLNCVEPTELAWQIATSLGATSDAGAPLFRQWRVLGDRLTELRYEHRTAIVLFDDADHASAEALGIVTRIVNIAAGTPLPLTVVAAVNTSTTMKLGRRFIDIADLRVELPPWTLEETAEYLETALQRAGAREPIFEHDAVTQLHAAASGSPRHINQIADMALLAGAAHAMRRLDAAVIDAVCDELGLHGESQLATALPRVGVAASSAPAF